jgi:hypothetical protein
VRLIPFDAEIGTRRARFRHGTPTRGRRPGKECFGIGPRPAWPNSARSTRADAPNVGQAVRAR